MFGKIVGLTNAENFGTLKRKKGDDEERRQNRVYREPADAESREPEAVEGDPF